MPEGIVFTLLVGVALHMVLQAWRELRDGREVEQEIRIHTLRISTRMGGRAELVAGVVLVLLGVQMLSI